MNPVIVISVAILAVVCLLELGPDARRWLARRVLRRNAPDPREAEDGAAPPPVIRSLHQDRSLRGGALSRYTSEGRALPVEDVTGPRAGR